MEFAITFKPDMPPPRIVSLTKQAEAAGFAYGWMFDSHVLWQEPFPLMTLMAANTERMRIGPCVTNPAVRDWTVTASLFATLNRISGGRMDIGIGRGDSSRRVMGKRPVTLAVLEECVQTVRDLCTGKQIAYEEKDIQMPWADAGVPPVWVAGYGPKALRCAGKIGDGVILQFADPHLIKWCLNFVVVRRQKAWFLVKPLHFQNHWILIQKKSPALLALNFQMRKLLKFLVALALNAKIMAQALISKFQVGAVM